MTATSTISVGLTTTSTRTLSVWVGGRDVTGDIQWSSFSLRDVASNSVGQCAFRIEGSINDFREVRDMATVLVFDDATGYGTDGSDLFRGYVISRRGVRRPRYNAIEVVAEDISGQLDQAVIGWEKRPAETDQARLGYLWGKYANGLSGDFSRVKSANALAALPAVNFAWVTLREAIEMVAASSHTDADYYVDNYGRLHFFASETNVAPFNVSDTAGGGVIVPHELNVEYDSASLANRITVQTSTVGRSYQNEQAIADADGKVRNTVVPAPEVVTAAHAAQVASLYLGRLKQAKPRGTFSADSTDGTGWLAGQTLTITSTDLNLSAYATRIYGVTVKVIKGATTGSPTYRYDIEWGGLRAGGYRWQ